MQLTNRLGLPDAFVQAVKNDPYDKGKSDYSITGLLKPPRMVQLTKWHDADVVEDVADRLWALLGQCMHVVLERANVEDIAERRYFAEFATKTVSGQIDSLSLTNGILTDWKLTTAFKFKRGKDPDPEFVAQLNMQRELLLRNNMGPIESLRIFAGIRDWNRFNLRLFDDFPEGSIVYQDIPVWPRERTQMFILERIALHEQARLAKSQEELPECSPTERWEKPAAWAVMKGKKAINFGVCFSEAEAKKKHDLNPGTRIEFRAGKSGRCDEYCSVSAFCKQYQKIKGVPDGNQVS